MKKTKNKKTLIEKIDTSKVYDPIEAIKILKENSYTKFEESIEIAINLGIDPNKTDQNIRGMINLPKGTGKNINVAVLTKGDKQNEAKEAGADLVGENDLIDSISSGKINFDLLIATPDMMPSIGKVAKILGPKGLMPSPKSGTVTSTLTETLADFKKGKFEYKADKTGIVHVSFGKSNFTKDKLIENLIDLYKSIEQNRPSGVKGKYFKSLYICNSMGPSIELDLAIFA
jgi:large subunit ribosomal protein L1